MQSTYLWETRIASIYDNPSKLDCFSTVFRDVNAMLIASSGNVEDDIFFELLSR